MKKIAVASLLPLALACGNASAVLSLPDFNAATFTPGTPITNPYYNQFDGTRVYTSTDVNGDPADERFEFQWLGAGKTLLGVQTWALRDRAFEGGFLVEDTFDYFAQDTAGNLWYFAEDVTNYEYDANGDLIGTNDHSSWLAGFNGAVPGYQMPAVPTVGQNYFQEFAIADNAADTGEITATGLTRTFAGTTYTDVVQVFETSPVDPGVLPGYKYFAPGIGLIGAEEHLDANLLNPELTFALAPVPEPTSAALLALGLSLVSAAAYARRKT